MSARSDGVRKLWWLRQITGPLWRYPCFRVFTIRLARRGWAMWFVANTPFLIAMRVLLLQQGNYEGALSIAGILRELGDL
ncbi:MAG: hypothetical protein V1796_07950 [Pseudomonadota bacterium]